VRITGRDGRPVVSIQRGARAGSPARQLAELLRKQPPAPPFRPLPREDYFPEFKTWGPIPQFIPEEGEWPEAALRKQEAAFRLGYKRLLKFPRPPRSLGEHESKTLPGVEGDTAPLLADLEECFPYFLFRRFERPLARVLLALYDPRVPKSVKKRLKVHLRDILRGDGLVYDARPSPLSSRPVRITPETKRAFPSLYRELLALCNETVALTREQICDVIRKCLPSWSGSITREAEIARLLMVSSSEELKPHQKAWAILSHVFGISDRYVRLLIYGK